MLWVVKRLAATTWPSGTIPASSICVGASCSDVRYALSAGLSLEPPFSLLTKSRNSLDALTFFPLLSRTNYVTTRTYRVCWSSWSSDSTYSVFVNVSHTTWLIPTTSPPAAPPGRVLPRLTRNTLWLVTLPTSIGPSNGIDRRGCRLNPSSSLRTSMSEQSDGRAAQSALGRSTRSPVFWVGSSTVNLLVGNGPFCRELRSN